MKILIVGSGGREYAIAKKLYDSKLKPKLFNVGDHYNPGLYKLCKGYCLVTDEIEEVIRFCRQEGIDFVIIGPEKYLEQGWADELWDSCYPTFGPHKLFATIETSKIYARHLLRQHKMHHYNPKYTFLDIKEHSQKGFVDHARRVIESNFDGKDYVIKADGLMGGKGVQVHGDHFITIHEALEFVEQIYKKGYSLIIEEKLVGEEFSLLTMTDSQTFIHFPLIKDFKRALPNDEGPNTGGMGSISYANHSMPFLTKEDEMEVKSINQSVIHILNDKYRSEHFQGYKGILYGSYIKTDSGIKLIEFNCRFGDPECINGLELLNDDLALLCWHTVHSTLHLQSPFVSFKECASVVKYLVPEGYPENPIKDEKICINTDNILDVDVIYASVGLENQKDEYPDFNKETDENLNSSEVYYMYGSRAVAVVSLGETVDDCSTKINYFVSENISGKYYYREDIGNSVTPKSVDSKSIKPLDAYAKSGVNIDEGNLTVNKIEEYVSATFNSNVVSKFGDFAGIFNLGGKKLVCSSDGVGTKSELSRIFFKNHGMEKLGHDIVNHCVNDILVKGAKPLFFMDYFASSQLDSEEVKHFVKGVSEACIEAGCVLLGGETAEMPGIYQKGKCDLAGFIVGMIENDEDFIDGKRDIVEGDVVVALPSHGPHTNGFSLIRKLIKLNPNDFSLTDITKLCSAHKSYLKEIIEIRNNNVDIHGLCHITGGGLIDNPDRVLPENLAIEWKEWDMPLIFQKLQTVGKLSKQEMWRTFNCGLGMLIFTSKEHADIICNLFPTSINVGNVIKN